VRSAQGCFSPSEAGFEGIGDGLPCMSANGTLVTCARRGSVSGLETFSDIGASAAHVAE